MHRKVLSYNSGRLIIADIHFFEMSQNGLIIARLKVFFCICIISDTYSAMNIVKVNVHSINAKK